MASLQTVGNRIPKLLYFIAGMVPTDREIEDASRFGVTVGMRNRTQVSDVAMSTLEECDAVAGDVPARYAKTYPNVTNLDLGGRMLRMSDVDRMHGPVHSVDNEAARAAKPPSVGQNGQPGQGAPRPTGAMTLAGGGWVAPQPGNPDAVQAFGSERAENGPEATAGERKQGAEANPHKLSDAGADLPPENADRANLSGPVAEGGGQGGFKAPEPVDEKPPGTPTFTD